MYYCLVLLDHLEKLKHFVGAVQAGSIRRYSILNRLSQPAVSKSLQTLEYILEQTLLVRSRNGLSMTAAGRKLFDFSVRTLSECNLIDKEIRKTSPKQFHGNLTIGTYHSIAVYFLPHLYRYLREHQKNFNLNIFTATTSELVKQVKAGSVDFIISVNPPKSRELFTEILYEDSFSLYRKKKSNIEPSEALIFTIDYTAPNGELLRSRFKRTKHKICICGDLEVVKAMVDADLGYGMLPERVAEMGVKSGSFELTDEPKELKGILRHQVALSYKKYRSGDSSLIWITQQTLEMLKNF